MATRKKPAAAKESAAWEIKDRTYYLTGNNSPIVHLLRSKNIYWFDEEKGTERELKFTSNQQTVFVDEFKGEARLAHIIFRDGVLNVPREKQTLQKLLSLYHPDLNKKYAEFNAEEEAVDELDIIQLEIEALMMAQNLDIEHAEAIVRVNVGSKVSTMTSSELKRDLLVFAKRDPELFLELAKDENIQVRNTGIKAVEAGIIKLAGDQRTFSWGSTGRKLMTVPFDENPYSALAAWFKTDEGVEVYQTIEKKLK
jgi:hypothetical protein